MTGARPWNVLHTTRSLRIDGITNVVLRTVPALDRSVVASHVCAVYGDDDLAHAFHERGIEPLVLRHRGAASAPASVARLVQIIRRRRIDLVHANQTVDLWLAGAAARICGVPVVATIHWLAGERGPRFGGGGGAGGAVRRMLRGAADRWMCSRLVAVSEAVRDTHAAALGHWFPTERVDVVYPGIDFDDAAVSEAERLALRDELGISARAPVLLNVGRLHPVKGQRHLLPMMEQVRARYPEATLLIAGGGELSTALAGEIAQRGLGDAVRLLGPRLDISRLLAASDVVVLASESEAAPLPLIEAMRAARPVVATRVGGVPEMVSEGLTGIIVPPGDPDALAAAVVRLAADPAAMRAMGAAARRRGRERFDIRVSARGLETVYAHVLGRS